MSFEEKRFHASSRGDLFDSKKDHFNDDDSGTAYERLGDKNDWIDLMESEELELSGLKNLETLSLQGFSKLRTLDALVESTE